MDERTSDPALGACADRQDVGLCAFFISREVEMRGDGDLIAQTVASKGFDPLLSLDLDEDRLRTLSTSLCLNALNIDPEWAASIVFVHDLLPITPSELQRQQDPACENARVLATRAALETEIDRVRGERASYVPAIATNTSGQAWSLLTALAPEQVGALQAWIGERAAAFATTPAIRDLSRYACRARVELIEHDGRMVVRKTFRPGSERFLRRELEVFDTLGPVCPAIPKLIGYGPNFLIMEYIDEADQLAVPRWPALLPLARVRQLAAFVRNCVGHGFDPVDLKPEGNALYTPDGVKIIDYEFWLRCDPATPPEKSYCLAGLPADFDGDRPMGLVFPFDPYPMKWISQTGLAPKSFLYDPAWLQALKRLAWSLRVWPRRLGSAVVGRIRQSDGQPSSAG